MSSPPVPARPSRWVSWLGPLVGVAGLVGTLAASAGTGPSFAEERRLQVIEHAMALPRAVADTGLGATVSAAARGIYDELAPHGIWPGLLSAWSGEWVRQHHIGDPLSAMRFGWLLITGLSPLWLHAIVASRRGPRAATLAAVILFATPRWIHGAAMGSEPVVVGSLWLLLLALYLHGRPAPLDGAARPQRRFRLFSVLFGLALGAAAAADLASLWILPLLVLHGSLGAGAAARREVRRARVELPFGFLAALLLAPLAALLLTPSLWRGGAVSAAGWFLGPLSPTVEPGLRRGMTVTANTVPLLYGADFLVATTPVLTTAGAVLGGFVLLGEWLERRRSSGRSRSRVTGLGWFSAAVLLAVLLGPFSTPDVLLRFPPRAEVALPFVAALAAVGFDHMATRVVGVARAPAVALAVGLAYLSTGLIGLPTAGASFGLLAGEAGGASRRWILGDGSELASLAPAIDGLGRPALAIQAPEVPRTYFATLRRLRRLRTSVEVVPRGSYVLRRGAQPSAIADVQHWGTTVWSLAP